MKKDRLIIGALLGGIIIFIGITVYSILTWNRNAVHGIQYSKSFDALTAAAGFHRLVFEDDKMRVTELIIPPGKETPPYRYKYRSVWWYTSASPIVIKKYRANSALRMVSSDTIRIRPDEINVSREEKPSHPVSLKNIGTDEFRLYRIEMK